MKTSHTPARRRGLWLRHRPIPDLLVRQIDHAIEGLVLARSLCRDGADAEESRGPMATIEHRGDDARAHLVDRMSTALTTPLDREDIFRASRSVDDVLDNLRDFVRELALWEVDPGPWAAKALDPAHESLQSLRKAAAVKTLSDARTHCLAARKAAGGVRRCYQLGLTEIFAGELTMDTLKQREVLRRLDVIGLRLAEATDALLDGLVKRSV